MFIINSKRDVSKGFTLVELLITVIIIGILAGSLVVGFGQMRAKVTATKIISDLRTMRSGLVLYHSDTGTWPTGGAGTWDVLKDYIDTDSLSPVNPTGEDKPQIYAVRVFQSGTINEGRMFVVANVNDNRKFGIDALVRSKLAERQAEYGLMSLAGATFSVYKKTHKIVFIEVNK